jgi:hypothetical protein
VPSAPATSAGAMAVSSATTRPYATTRARANGPARPTDHGRSADLSPAEASSPRDAPTTPAARTPARAFHRATPSSAPARCARRLARGLGGSHLPLVIHL